MVVGRMAAGRQVGPQHPASNMQLQLLSQIIKAPCTGAEAKALGKAWLQTEFGLDVTFQSYQEAAGKQKLWLDDDTPVIRGSILNFTVEMEAVLSKQVKHDKMLAMLTAPLLQDLVFRFAGCLLTGKISELRAAATKFQDAVASDPALRQYLSAALTSVNAELSVEQMATSLDNTYKDRCDNTHVNTTSVLRKQMDEMRKSGALELLSDKYPVECLIVQHHEVFLQLLHDTEV